MSDSRTVYEKKPDNQDFSLLLRVPLNDVREDNMYPHLSIATLGIFARTCQQAESETALLRSLPAAINAAPEFVDAQGNKIALASIAILRKHPESLLRKRQIIDHYGRPIWASPYQLFLGAGDVWAIKQVHTDILPLIPDEGAIAKAQFKEQFPNYNKKLDESMDEEARFYDDRNIQQIEEIRKQLATVKLLIDADPFNHDEPLDATKQAIEALCKLFRLKPGEVIRSGLHFPLAIIKEIYKTYDALQRHWPFYSMVVIKPALDALSTVDGQCFQYGLKNLDMDEGPSRRCHSAYTHPKGKPLNLTFVNDEARGAAVLVDPHDGEVLFVSSTLGYFDCYNKEGQLRPAAANGIRKWCFCLGAFARVGKLMEKKAEVYENYCAAVHREVNTLSRSQ